MWNKISPRLWFSLSLSNKRRSSVLKLYLLFAFFPSFVNSGSFCAFYSILNIFFFRICFVFHFTFPWCVSTISLHFPAFWLFSVLVGFSSDVVFWLENNVFLLTKTIDIGAPQIEYSLWQVEAGCRLLKKNDTHLNCGFSIGHQKGSMFVDWMGNKWLTWRLRPNMRSTHHTHIHVCSSEQAHFWFGSSTFTKDLLVFHRETLCRLFAMHFFRRLWRSFVIKIEMKLKFTQKFG